MSDDRQNRPPAPSSQPIKATSQPAPHLYRLIQRFDFNERPLGNYEETPMRWVRLTGPGLPSYSKGRFDDEAGHLAPPSFRLSIMGGNVVYEYQRADPAVIPESDYAIVGHIRAQDLHNARAFIAAYLVDRFGERIPGSERISNLVQSTGATPEPWQKAELFLSVDEPNAAALRLQVWVLQTYVWQEAEAERPDPIVRRDMRAEAWFDDITVSQLPRARLRLSNPAGLVLPNRAEELLFNVTNTSGQTLGAELTITDVAGRVVQHQQISVPPLAHDRPPVTGWKPVPQNNNGKPTPQNKDGKPIPHDIDGKLASHNIDEKPVAHYSSPDAPAAIRIPLAPQPPGLYAARLRLTAGDETLLSRSLRFAVLAELPPGEPPRADFGVDVGRWRGGDAAGMRALLSNLHCAAVKIGIPLVGVLNTPEKVAYFQQITALLQEFLTHRIEATGVLLAPGAATNAEQTLATRRLIETDPDWPAQLSPVLAQLGSLITSWQLGEEEIELRQASAAAWPPHLLKKIREQLLRFVTVPEIVVPHSALNAVDGLPLPGVPASQPLDGLSNYRVSLWAPAAIPARALLRQADAPDIPGEVQTWLRLEADAAPALDRETRLADLARRLVLAKTLGVNRIYVSAPFELAADSGGPAWQPTEAYLILRTLFAALSGKQAVDLLPVGRDAVALVFEGPQRAARRVVFWTWRDGPVADSPELYLGPQPVVRDLWGRSRPLEVRNGRTRLPLKPMPQILENANVSLALLQTGFRVEPTHVPASQTQTQTTVSLHNPYDREMSASLEFETPSGWKLTPKSLSLTLAPGETWERPLDLTVPPRQVAATQTVTARLHLRSPEQARLEFEIPFTVELRDIVIEVRAHWRGDDLLVEHSLQNLSERRINFSAFCQPPTRPRLERAFLGIGPGETAVQTYVLRAARDLAGTSLHLGVREIRGVRALDQLVEVPP